VQYFGRGIEAGVAKANPEVVYWYLSVRATALKGKSQAPRELLEQVVSGFHAPLQAIVTATRPEDLRLDELFERAALPQWGSGAVTLLGDAAHPMLPHAGQGAAQALEDAVALARALRAERPLEVSLRRYEKVRSGRTSTIVRVAKRNAQLGVQHPRLLAARHRDDPGAQRPYPASSGLDGAATAGRGLTMT
jgi:2-polyprenyl-6-methoxyphenol hydroxylase-like FAD-dependent oxidoreductase